MTFRKCVMISIALFCISGFLSGCSDDNTVAPTPTTVSEAPLAAPTGLSVALMSNGDVSLRWDNSTQPNLSGYKVYRHSVTESAIGLLTVDPIATNYYVDTDADRGPVYEYLVTAVSTKGAESAYATITIKTERLNDRGVHRETL